MRFFVSVIRFPDYLVSVRSFVDAICLAVTLGVSGPTVRSYCLKREQLLLLILY